MATHPLAASCIPVRSLTLSYLIVGPVIYMCICESSYPRKLAFSYLDELSKEFSRSYGDKVETATRPYAFMGFGEYGDAAIGQVASPLAHLAIAMSILAPQPTAHTRHIHLQDDSPVPRLAELDARRTGSWTDNPARPAEREPAGRDAHHDQEHGGPAVARRQLGS